MRFPICVNASELAQEAMVNLISLMARQSQTGWNVDNFVLKSNVFSLVVDPVLNLKRFWSTFVPCVHRDAGPLGFEPRTFSFLHTPKGDRRLTRYPCYLA